MRRITNVILRWADPAAFVRGLMIPLLAVFTAIVVGSIFMMINDYDPIAAYGGMLDGALGSKRAIARTILNSIPFVFGGLSVAFAFKGGLFNIGGEGQLFMGAVAAAWIGVAALGIPPWLHVFLSLLAGCMAGAIWGGIPGALKAFTGAHEVITTIMFNFIASALMVFLLVDVIRDTNQMGPQTASIAKELWFPMFKDITQLFGIKTRYSPLNISFFLAILALFFVWFLIWRTKWGYEMRAVGHNTRAAVYAGISPHRNIIIAMLISGALAGMLGVNEILGVHHRVIVNFPAGYGFTGIAVALMGRNHPIGIFLGAFLFGMLYQGGSEVTFDMPNISRYMFVAVQGVIILFSGALENLFRPQIESFFVKRLNKEKVA